MKGKKFGIVIFALGILFLCAGVIYFVFFNNLQVPKNIAEKFEYDYVSGASKNYVVVSNDEKYGYAKVDGKVVIPISYEMPTNEAFYSYLMEKDGLFTYTKDDQFGVIDSNNKVVLEAKYAKVMIIDNDTFLVQNLDNTFCLVNKKGEETSKKYQSMYAVDKNKTIFVVSENFKQGLIDNTGKVLVPVEYSGGCHTEYGSGNIVILHFIGDNNKMALYAYDTKLVTVEDEKLLGYNSFKNDTVYYIAKKDENNNTIVSYNVKANEKKEDVSDKEVAEDFYLVYDEATGKEGLVGKDGTKLTEAIYDVKYSSYKPGTKYVIVGIDAKIGAVDATGKEILPLKYDRVILTDDNFFVAYEKGKATLFDSKGTTIYTGEDINYIEDENIFVVKKDGKFGILNGTGDVLYQITYFAYNYSHDYVLLQAASKSWVIAEVK